jgi:pyrroline-5-carboxylate reductase
MKIGIVGVGNIGSIIARILLEEGHSLFLVDRHIEKAENFKGAEFSKDVDNLERDLDILFLSIKPQDAVDLMIKIASEKHNFSYIVSTVAGLEIEEIKQYFSHSKISRIMPNIPIAIGKGVVGISYDKTFSKDDKKLVSKLLKPFGTIVEVKERLISSVTALSGSGPAFVFVIVEALIDAGIKLGLSYEVAMEMVLQTLKGSVELLEAEKKHPGELRHIVTSPAGTTIEGIYSLEQSGLRGILMKTIFDTYQRATELSEKVNKDVR